MIVVTHRHRHRLALKNMGHDMATTVEEATVEEATVKPPTKRIRLQCQYPLLLVGQPKPTKRMVINILIIIQRRHHSRHPRDIISIIQKRQLKVEVGGRVIPSIMGIATIITIRGLLLQNLVTTLLGHPLFSQVHHQCLIIALKVIKVHTLLTESLFLLTEILIPPIEVTTTHRIQWMHLFHRGRIMREGVILLIVERKPIHLAPLHQITTTAARTRDRPPPLYQADSAAIMLLLHDIIMQKIVVVNLRQGLRF